MEYKDPVFDLLSNLEQIVLKQPQRLRTPVPRFNELNGCVRAQALKTDDFANAMGVSVAMVEE